MAFVNTLFFVEFDEDPDRFSPRTTKRAAGQSKQSSNASMFFTLL
jgi:hypothetical protein